MVGLTPPLQNPAPEAPTRTVVGSKCARGNHCIFAVLACAHLTGATAVCAVPAEVAAPVPSDVVAAYFSFMGGSTPASLSQPNAGSPPRTLAVLELGGMLADQAFRLGLLSQVDECSRMWIDALAAAATVWDHPLTIILFDVSARARRDGGHELAHLQAALVVLTRGANNRIEQRIQHLLTTYTSTAHTRLATTTRHGTSVYTLTDGRLPSWARISWGRQGDYFVVAVGDGAFSRVVETLEHQAASLAHDPWFARAADARQMDRKVDGATRPASTMGLYISFNALRDGADPVLADKMDRVQNALGLSGAHRAFVTVGRRGRAVVMKGSVRHADTEDIRVLADPKPAGRLRPPAIPEEAECYAVLPFDPGTVFTAFRDAYIASRSPRAADDCRRFWRTLEETAGVSLESDILARLGGPILVHDFPRHALRLPFTWTIVLPIQRNAGTLRGGVDALLASARTRLDEVGGIQLRRADDGIWYLQYGLIGPAVGMSQRFLVISFSPYAVRENLKLLSAQPVPDNVAPDEAVDAAGE